MRVPRQSVTSKKTENLTASPRPRVLASLLILFSCFLLPSFPLPLLPIAQAQTTQNREAARKAEADRLLDQGVKQLDTSQYRAAIQSFQQALAIYRDIKHRNGEARALGNLGNAYGSISQQNKAIEYYQQALPIFKALSDRNGEAGILTNLGIAYGSLSQYHKAIEYFQQALPIFQKLSDRNEEAGALNNLGVAYGSLSQYQKAIEYFQQALPIFQAVGNRNGEAVTLNNLGNAYVSLSQYQKAIEYFQQALPIFQAVGNRNGEAMALGNLGNAYLSLWQYHKAIEYYQQALPIFQKVGDRNSEAGALMGLGNAYLSLWQYHKAIEYYQQALPIYQQVGDRNSEARALNNLGSAYLFLWQYHKAIEYYQQALPIYQQVGDRNGEARALNNIGNLLADQNQPELAIVFYKQSVNQYETIRQDIRTLPRELQESYTQSVAKTYRRLANLLLSQGRILEAQQVLELLKIQELRDFTRNARTGGQIPGIALDAIETEIITKHGTLIAFGQKIRDCQTSQCGELDKLITQRTALTTAYQQDIQKLEAVIKARKNQDENFLDPKNELSKEAQEIIQAQPGTVLIYPLVLDDKLWLLMATEGSIITKYEVKVSQQELADTVLKFRELLATPNSSLPEVQETSQKLYNWLIKPLEAQLKAKQQRPIKHLVFAPDRVTRYIPMGALFDGKQYLIENYTVTNIVSAKLTNTSDRLTGGKQNTPVLALGLSNAVPGFGALPNVPVELDGIVRRDNQDKLGVYPGSEFLNQAFDFPTLQKNLFGRKILHVATHGAFVPGKFEDSYLVLGTGDKMPISQIQTLEDMAGVHLVVLSACETALGGRDKDGIEIAGISNSFLERGAKAVMASLWLVNDASTSLLMQQFYKNIAENPQPTKAEALRQAQLSLLQGKITAKDATDRSVGVFPRPGVRPTTANRNAPDFSHPYYWAPFILIGNGL